MQTPAIMETQAGRGGQAADAVFQAETKLEAEAPFANMGTNLSFSQ